MSIELTPLEPDQLPASLHKTVGPGAPAALKLMAARGLAPLGPGDLATALYQLSHDSDPAVAGAADQSAGSLPEKVLRGALTDALDPRVLHFFAHRVDTKTPLVELILLNPKTDDDTFSYLALVCRERELEIIAQAEERCLRTPAIVAHLYRNKQARMSTVDRLVELCVRNEVEVEGIPHFKEIAHALGLGAKADDDDDAVADTLFREALEADPDANVDVAATDDAVEEIMRGEEPAQEVVDPRRMGIEQIKGLTISAKMRLATIGSAFHRAVLIRDSNKQVAMAAIKSPSVGDNEVVKYAANRALHEEVIRHIASQREFLKSYQVKVHLVNNAKCPLPTSMRLLTYLRERDLRTVARSKSVSATLATTAKKILAKKGK